MMQKLLNNAKINEASWTSSKSTMIDNKKASLATNYNNIDPDISRYETS